MRKIGIVILLFIFSLNLKAQIIDTVCVGNPIGKYKVSGMSGSIFFWTVNGGNLTSVNGNDSVYVFWDVLAPIHKISVVEISKDGCLGDSISGSVIFRNSPLLGIVGKDSACIGTTLEIKGIGGIEYLWNNGDTTSSIFIKVLRDSLISFIGTDGCGYDTVYHFVKALPLPISSIKLKPEKPFVDLNSMLLSSGAGCSTYSWYLDQQFLSNTGPTLWHVFKNEGLHTIGLIVGNEFECSDTSELEIEVRKGMITAFTPNNDGVNDVWELDELVNYPNCTVTIIDKWGGIAFESKGYKQPWDGTRNGVDLPAGSYAYLIDFGDNSEVIKGTVTLIR